jgi:hypothetical protein
MEQGTPDDQVIAVMVGSQEYWEQL